MSISKMFESDVRAIYGGLTIGDYHELTKEEEEVVDMYPMKRKAPMTPLLRYEIC